MVHCNTLNSMCEEMDVDGDRARRRVSKEMLGVVAAHALRKSNGVDEFGGGVLICIRNYDVGVFGRKGYDVM